MNITIQSLGFKAGAALQNFIADKVGKLFRHSDHIMRAEVTLRRVDNGSQQNMQCDIRLMIPGNDHLVSKSTNGYEKSILESVRTMQKILRGNKQPKMFRKVRNGFKRIL